MATLFVFIAALAFAGIFVKEAVAYALMLFGSVLWFAAFQKTLPTYTIAYVAGAYLAIIIILRILAIRFPQKATALNMGLAKILDVVFRFLTGRTLTDRLLEMKKMGEQAAQQKNQQTTSDSREE